MSQTLRIALSLSLLLAASCKGDKEAKKTPAPTEKEDAKSGCAARASALGTWMKAAVAEGVQTQTAGIVDLVEVAQPPRPIPAATAVSLTADHVTVNGLAVTDPEDAKLGSMLLEVLKAAFGDRQKMQAQRGDDDPHLRTALLIVDQKATWGAFVTAAAAAGKAGYTNLALLFDAKSAVEPPPASPLDAEMRKALAPIADPSVSDLGQIPEAGPFDRVFSKCKPAMDLITAKGGPYGQARWELTADRLPATLEECTCQVDDGEVKAWFWAALGRYSVASPMTVVSVESVAAGASPVRVAQKADRPWSEAYKMVVDAAAKDPKMTLESGK